MAHRAAGPVQPGFRDAFVFWLKLGFINFGAPTVQISMMHQEQVERRRWIGEDRFLHAQSFRSPVSSSTRSTPRSPSGRRSPYRSRRRSTRSASWWRGLGLAAVR